MILQSFYNPSLVRLEQPLMERCATLVLFCNSFVSLKRPSSVNMLLSRTIDLRFGSPRKYYESMRMPSSWMLEFVKSTDLMSYFRISLKAALCSRAG